MGPCHLGVVPQSVSRNQETDENEMATENALQRLNRVLDDLASVEMDEVKRTRLGRASLAPDLDGMEEDIDQIAHLAKSYGKLVHDEIIQSMIETVHSIASTLESQSDRSDTQFTQNRALFIESLRRHIEGSRRWQPIVASCVALDKGLYDAESLKAEVQRSVANFKGERERFLEGMQAALDNNIKEFNKHVEKMIDQVRRTAQGVSVEEAQKQFREAAPHDKKRVWLWTGLSVLASAVLLVVGVVSIRGGSQMLTDPTWESLPGVVLRLFLLSVLAGMATFTFRMLRAHLHIAEKNRHRVRVANSIDSFLQSTSDPSQRDLIFAKLVDSIVSYGDSGLVQHEVEDRSSPMSGDLVGRILAAMSGKGAP